MATKTSGPEEWKVRVSDGEYAISCEELEAWVLEGKVTERTQVLPPTTRRWTLASNVPELEAPLAVLAKKLAHEEQRQAHERWIREAPLREAEARLAATRHRWDLVSGCGAAVMVLAFFLALKLEGSALRPLLMVAGAGLVVSIWGAIKKPPKHRY